MTIFFVGKKLTHRTACLLRELIGEAVDFLFPFIKRNHRIDYGNEINKILSSSTFIVSPQSTLNAIESCIINNQAGCYLRFGDGDVFLLSGRDDMLQKSNIYLAKEMHEALMVKGDNIFKCLTIHSEVFGFEKEMFSGNHKNTEQLALELMRIAFPYFVGYKIYSPVALHYEASYNVSRANSFLRTLKSKTNIFIGNESISSDVMRLLFGNVLHIKTPSENAYDQIDRIEKEAIDALIKISDFSVVCVAMGCSGRPLMKRLWGKKFNIFLFDFGSLLDGICGNQTRTWMKVVNIDYMRLLKGLQEEKGNI